MGNNDRLPKAGAHMVLSFLPLPQKAGCFLYPSIYTAPPL